MLAGLLAGLQFQKTASVILAAGGPKFETQGAALRCRRPVVTPLFVYR